MFRGHLLVRSAAAAAHCSSSCCRASSVTRRLSTLSALEEFPFNAELRPAAPSTPMITASKTNSGITVVSRDFNSSSVSLKIAIVGGSAAESASQKGSARLLSASAFAGTQTTSGISIVLALDKLGAKYDVYADREKIVYDVKVLPDGVEPALQTVMEAIGSPPFEDYFLNESKEISFYRYQSYAEDSTAQLYELINEAAYSETSPLGGSQFALSLSKLATPDILQYRAKTFVSGNIIVAGNGISHDQLKKMVEATAKQVPEGPRVDVPKSEYVGGEVKVRTDLNGLTHIALAFPVPAGEASKPYAVLKAYLAKKLAALNLCAAPVSFEYNNGGLLAIHASGAPEQAAEFLNAAVNELKAVAKAAPADVEMFKLKVSLENFLALEGEDSSSMLINAQLRGMAPDALADARQVTAASMSAAASAVLKANPAYAVLGATAGTPSYATVRSWLQ